VGLRGAGAQLVAATADVADRDALASVLAQAAKTLPPVRGVVHAAGVLDDGVLAQQTAARYRTVARPKADGAWNVHELTTGLPLDFFVCFSSAASLVGSPGQGNYAAANAFLDALAGYRRSKGLPGLSVNWGPWSEVGMAAQAQRGKNLAQRGMESLSPDQGALALDRLLRQPGLAQAGVFRVSAKQWREFYQMGGQAPLLADLAREAADAAGEGKGGQVREAVLAAPPQQRQRMVEQYLAGVLGFAYEKLDVSQPLDQLGLDSLMAIELKNRVEVDLGVTLTMAHFLQMPSMEQLAATVLAELPDGEAPGEADRIDEVLQKLEQLSDEEVQALLAQEQGPQLTGT
jgi:acyl carrier protein